MSHSFEYIIDVIMSYSEETSDESETSFYEDTEEALIGILEHEVMELKQELADVKSTVDEQSRETKMLKSLILAPFPTTDDLINTMDFFNRVNKIK